MDGNNPRSLRRCEGAGSLEGRFQHCSQSAHRRADGPDQSAGDLRNERQLGKGSLTAKGFHRMQISKVVLTAFCVSVGLFAQTPAPPVQAKRLPPEKSKGKAPTGSDTLIDRYD